MAIATLSTKYQIVVPKEIREKMNLKAGSTISVYPIDENQAIIRRNPEDIVEATRGIGKEAYKSLGGAEAYLKRERESWNK